MLLRHKNKRGKGWGREGSKWDRCAPTPALFTQAATAHSAAGPSPGCAQHLPTQRKECGPAGVPGQPSEEHGAQGVDGPEADHHVAHELDPQGAGGVGLRERTDGHPRQPRPARGRRGSRSALGAHPSQGAQAVL